VFRVRIARVQVLLFARGVRNRRDIARICGVGVGAGRRGRSLARVQVRPCPSAALAFGPIHSARSSGHGWRAGWPLPANASLDSARRLNPPNVPDRLAPFLISTKQPESSLINVKAAHVIRRVLLRQIAILNYVNPF